MAEKQSFSIKGNRKNKALVEHVAEAVFTVCALLAVVAVASITVYMIINGTPALFKVGIKEILFGTVWQPAAKDPSFGILYHRRYHRCCTDRSPGGDPDGGVH